jgi:hypothetical protein
MTAMQQLQKLFDNSKVKVMAGDFTPGDWEFKGGILWGAFDQINLVGDVKSSTLQTEESVKKLSETLGWGLAGAVIFGPMGLLAGLVMGGNKKEVCALTELKDGRKFLAVMDAKIYQQILGYSLSKS